MAAKGRGKAASSAFNEICSNDIWALDSAEWTAASPGYEPLESCLDRFAKLLQNCMRHNGVRSAVEFGCGFWSYALAVDWSGIEYDGNDVAEGPIRWNRDHYGAPVAKDSCPMTGLPEATRATGAIVRDADA